jgi:hypothetical protein
MSKRSSRLNVCDFDIYYRRIVSRWVEIMYLSILPIQDILV